MLAREVDCVMDVQAGVCALAPPRVSTAVSQTRNLQLDFFRGLALIVIFINHMPYNPWYWLTPSRFGFSDATEIFVFISGYTSALAYGRHFDRAGFWSGCRRIFSRCSQIYAVHIVMFLLLAAVCLMGNWWLSGEDYIRRLNLTFFFEYPAQALLGLATLRYVPNYFDILPMYLVVLLMVPIVWGLGQIHKGLALAFSCLLYVAALFGGWELSAELTSNRPWFFNPLCWQLLFFTGFALGAGYIKVPPKSFWLAAICGVLVVGSIPFAHDLLHPRTQFTSEIRAIILPWLDKSHLGLLRYVHIMVLAYLFNQLLNWKPAFLSLTLSQQVIRVGQNSLPMFLCCMLLSFVGGMLLDWIGRDLWSVALINSAGLASIVLLANMILRFKRGSF